MDPKAKEWVENFASSLKAGKTQVFVTETDKDGPTKTETAAEETTTDSPATKNLDRNVLFMVLGCVSVAGLMAVL